MVSKRLREHHDMVHVGHGEGILGITQYEIHQALKRCRGIC